MRKSCRFLLNGTISTIRWIKKCPESYDRENIKKIIISHEFQFSFIVKAGESMTRVVPAHAADKINAILFARVERTRKKFHFEAYYVFRL